MWRAIVFGARPKTLLVSVMPILLATALVALELSAVGQKPSLVLFLSALVSAVLIQVGTNLVNDVADFERGADTKTRRGPQRVTQSGLCKPREVWSAAILCFGLSIIAALPLIAVGGVTLLAIGLLCIAAGYAYTAGPMPLAYRGLGELFVFVFFGPVSVGTLGWIFKKSASLEGAVTSLEWLAATQIGLLAVVILGVNNLRDLTEDARAGKRTLAVRLGANRYRSLLSTCVLSALGLGIFWALSGHLYLAVLPGVLLPFAFSIIQSLWSDNDGATWNRILGQSALLHAAFVGALCVGVLFEF